MNGKDRQIYVFHLSRITTAEYWHIYQLTQNTDRSHKIVLLSFHIMFASIVYPCPYNTIHTWNVIPKNYKESIKPYLCHSWFIQYPRFRF